MPDLEDMVSLKSADMLNRSNGAVSIQLRNLHGINLEEESDEEDGKGPAVQEIIEAREKAMHRWNTFFTILCAFAVFIDPLFCYIYVIKEDYMCFSYDNKLMWAYVGLRMAIDVFYVIDIIIFLRGICKKRKGRKFRECWKPRTDNQTSTVRPWKQVIKRCYFLDLLPILPRILVALPIPEALVLSSLQIYWDPTYVIFIFTPIQYTLRIFLIYGSQRWCPIKKTTTERWLKLLLDFLPFILASHLFGALWYRLAVQRQIDCWKPHCKTILLDECKKIDDFDCEYDYGSRVNSTQLQELCPTKNVNPKVFDFGIYFYALQSSAVGSTTLSRRISQSVWWALRNLSSFGSNLSTSMQTLEIFFSIVISISGMALFLVYLNARVQESKERSNQLKAKEKKHVMKPDIDLWLSKNNLSKLKTMTKDSKNLKRNNKKKKALKTVIIENIHKLEENKDIDVQNIISIIPMKYKKSIMRLLCLASLKKVPLLANLNEKMLKVICEHLKPVIYTEDNYIVQEGKPLGMMLFITQGIAWTYTTSEIDGAETSIKWLKRGDSYGEELLNWAFKCPSFCHLPISTRTVMSQEKVEAFALRAFDLKSIVSKFWWHFTRELHQAELKQWENLAASSMQAAWRSRVARARRSTLWDKFTVE